MEWMLIVVLVWAGVSVPPPQPITIPFESEALCTQAVKTLKADMGEAVLASCIRIKE